MESNSHARKVVSKLKSNTTQIFYRPIPEFNLEAFRCFLDCSTHRYSDSINPKFYQLLLSIIYSPFLIYKIILPINFTRPLKNLGCSIGLISIQSKIFYYIKTLQIYQKFRTTRFLRFRRSNN